VGDRRGSWGVVFGGYGLVVSLTPMLGFARGGDGVFWSRKTRACQWLGDKDKEMAKIVRAGKRPVAAWGLYTVGRGGGRLQITRSEPYASHVSRCGPWLEGASPGSSRELGLAPNLRAQRCLDPHSRCGCVPAAALSGVISPAGCSVHFRKGQCGHGIVAHSASYHIIINLAPQKPHSLFFNHLHLSVFPFWFEPSTREASTQGSYQAPSSHAHCTSCPPARTPS
jgi:hypothetical protein